MHNIELKVQCTQTQQQTIQTLLHNHHARYLRTMWQRDTYFTVPNGRLKLREWQHIIPPEDQNTTGSSDHTIESSASGSALIAYTRPDQRGSRLSEYHLCPIETPETLIVSLNSTLGIQVIIEKKRHLYMLGITRVHLDEVTGLGHFVELETLVDEASSMEQAQQEHQDVIHTLGLHTLTTIAGSYSDLLKALAQR